MSIKKLTQIPIRLIDLVTRGKITKNYLLEEIKYLDENGREFLSLLERPKKSEQVFACEEATEPQCKTAIILQGPLVQEEKFTLETIKIYNKIYPGCVIIVSTWNDENATYIDQIKSETSCEIVLSTRPKHSGILNLNFQVASTLAGLYCAKRMGIKYAFKTRTDFRFIKYGLIDFLYNLLQMYPISIDYQKYRIVLGGDCLCSMFRAFWVADKYNFGYIDDMIQYWNYDMDNVSINRQKIENELFQNERISWRERTEKKLCAEPNIIRNYLSRFGEENDCSVKTYWNALERQFIMMSETESGAYWVKYFHKYTESSIRGIYYGDNRDNINKLLSYNWDYVKWLNLLQGTLIYEDAYEKYQIHNYHEKGKMF